MQAAEGKAEAIPEWERFFEIIDALELEAMEENVGDNLRVTVFTRTSDDAWALAELLNESGFLIDVTKEPAPAVVWCEPSTLDYSDRRVRHIGLINELEYQGCLVAPRSNQISYEPTKQLVDLIYRHPATGGYYKTAQRYMSIVLLKLSRYEVKALGLTLNRTYDLYIWGEFDQELTLCESCAAPGLKAPPPEAYRLELSSEQMQGACDNCGTP